MPKGSAPGVSVGHTCTFIPAEDEGKGRILIVGGANPSGSFSHSHTINLGKEKTIDYPSGTNYAIQVLGLALSFHHLGECVGVCF